MPGPDSDLQGCSLPKQIIAAVLLPGLGCPMPQGSSASVGSDSKRRRPLPAPRRNADLQPFTPDSSVVSDVIPSANFGDRAKDRGPDMIVLHYTGMPDVEGAR